MTGKSDFLRVFTGSPWEPVVGYCRALRAGNLIFVTGTAPIDDAGQVYAPGDAYRQARRCLEIIERAVRGLLTPTELDSGPPLRHIVRTRMFVTNIGLWKDCGKAHAEFFATHPPCATMVEVKSLIDPAMLIEIEADGVCSGA